MFSRLFSSRTLAWGSALLATCLLSASAWADGFYADVHGGATFIDQDSARITAQNSGGSVNAHTNFDPGWLAGASGGYDWAQGFATEFEFTFRQNHLNRMATSGPLFVGGDMHSFAMMFNGYYCFHNATPFTPYIGGGLGEAVNVLNNARPTFLLNSGTFGGTDGDFAYQGIAGVSYPIERHLSAAIEYRYFATLRPGFEQRLAGGEVKASPSYNTQNAVIRLVYNF